MKKWVVFSTVSFAVLGLVACAEYASSQSKVSEQVIKINAHRFAFSPNVITLKVGAPVILEFTSSDVIMGFNAPDLKSRVDIIPGKVTRVRIVPEKIGMVTFFCDIFCGSGHEDMSGIIKVEA